MKIFFIILLSIILYSCQLEDQDNSEIYNSTISQLGCWNNVQNDKKSGHYIRLIGERIFTLEQPCSNMDICGLTDITQEMPSVFDSSINEYNQCGQNIAEHSSISPSDFNNLEIISDGAEGVNLLLIGMENDNSTEANIVQKTITGQIIWKKTISNNPATILLSELVVDSSSNIIVAGQIEWYASHPHALGHETTADNFMEDGGTLGPWNYNDGFIRKYDRNGNILWTHWIGAQIDGLGNPDEKVTSLAIDNNDNIYIAGTTTGKFNSTSFGDLSNQDIFIAKIDGSGQRLWIKSLGTSSEDNSPELSVSDSAIYLTGYSAGDIDGSTTANDSGIFLSSFALDGNLNFLKIISQSVFGSGYTKTSVDKDNSLYIIYNNNLADVTRGAIIVKLDVQGEIIWKKNYFESNDGDLIDFEVDSDGNLFLTGYANENYDDSLNLSSSGGPNMIILKLDKNGLLQ